jgi:hypothetical protein
MRKEFIKEVIKEVYGPRNGVNEELSDNPIDEYLTGVIIPQEFELSTDEGINDPDSEITKDGGDLNPEDNSSDDEIDVNVPSELDPRMRTKSFGISFIIEAQKPSFKICITWGRYFQNNDKEENKNLWKRRSYYDIHEISFDNSPEEFRPIELDNKEKDGKIILYVKKTRLDTNEKFHITANVVNNLDIGKKEFKPTSTCIFQPSIRINLVDEKQLPNFDQIKKENELDFIYRNRPFKAHGHMCSALWHDIDYVDEFETRFLWPDGEFHSNNDVEVEKFIKPHLRTEFVPLYPMPLSSFVLDDEKKLSAEVLSGIWSDEDFDKFLSPLVEQYKIWIKNNVAEKENLPDKYKKTAENLIKKQNMALERIKLGLDTLRSNDDAKLAFCFANKAISLQYEWSGKTEPFSWRAFQLAFFLMNIESIYNEHSDDRDILDLLWISTGGGKTEAYLAIMAFTMALRRIKALDPSNETTGGGTSIISRYTLRLLTVQQFRRTLRLITAAEFLRILPNKDGKIGWRPSPCEIENDWIYGSSRFSVGMWVGGAVSPLHLRKKEWGAIASLRKSDEDGEENSGNGEPAQIIKCPVCGAWLTIPQTGLPKEDNKAHFVVKLLEKDINISSIINNLKDSLTFIEDIDFTDKNHLEGNLTLSFTFTNQKIEKKDIDALCDQIKDKFVPASLNLHRPGYFGSMKDLAQNKERDEYSDFEIWCPDPDCDLNNASWKEGVPYKDDDDNTCEFPDGSYERIIISPFKKGSRIPIPAYTVDEQVYARCPTVIISTADKIARLAFEPRAAAIFGNVDCYNQFYGYHRENLFPDNSPIASRAHDMPVEPFSAPDLIIQDELHLIDGPLGSLFGLYETIVDGIIKKKGGNAKYIASTATIMNASEQVNLLFSKNLYQFPPYGLSIDDSFFVKEEIPESAWDEENKGRIYMGLYAPGRGPMTPQVNLWARILKTSYDHKRENNILYYWTLVGYYNAIRELGGGGALYREDIVERLKTISKGEHSRTLDQDHTIELSSRMNSTVIPLKLSEIERDGKRSENESPFYDAIFTTSMFGTGVDISHLSMMIVNGQPKTTGSYIQATGRIGRSHGGLIITFYKAGRPRDLSHYETFPSYHHRIHMGIEPVSVSPFSKGALWKAIGATTVSFLRNAEDMGLNWHDEDGRIICDSNAMDDIEYLCKHLESRLNDIYGQESESTSSTLKFLKTQIQRWKKIADNVEELKFYEYSSKWHEPKSNVILGDPAHEHAKYLETVYKNVPQSLREIEETTGFWV